ncbi:MAG: DUF1295 domain-containing protein [Rhodobacteraceae bacterium]|nr:DUF1295 domain-containing protein [Paracoccaceae bacterium]
MLKWIDIPPVWLALFGAVAWRLARADLWGLSFGGAWSDFLAGILIGGGLILMLLAVVEMRKWRTTFIPHREASHLVQSGIFRRSRNPIYLGDVLVLTGFILKLDAPEALVLVPIFLWWIERHFILAEEDRLRRKFRADFARYCAKTRRWL